MFHLNRLFEKTRSKFQFRKSLAQHLFSSRNLDAYSFLLAFGAIIIFVKSKQNSNKIQQAQQIWF